MLKFGSYHLRPTFLKLKSKLLETFLEGKVQATCCHELPTVGGKFPVWSYQHPASSPLFPAFKSLLPFYSPQRLEVLARRGWGSAGSPGGRSPGCGQQGVVCVTQAASCSSAGWSGLSWQRTDGHPDPGRPGEQVGPLDAPK